MQLLQVGAILGFSPDVFLFVLIGHWIDTYGALGYTYTFLFQLGIMVVSVFSTLFILRRRKMQEKQELVNKLRFYYKLFLLDIKFYT
ncbi:MAG: hypothetical protein ACLTK8_00130 [Paeniclostridium sp.]